MNQSKPLMTRVGRWMLDLWRFVVLTAKILLGVYFSKRLSAFFITYKISYVVADDTTPNAIVNNRIPPQVKDCVELPDGKYEVTEVQMVTPPRENFCFLQAICKPISKISD